jgi:predicted methyltransferase MtxX (methanogen marker protein 4)
MGHLRRSIGLCEAIVQEKATYGSMDMDPVEDKRPVLALIEPLVDKVPKVATALRGTVGERMLHARLTRNEEGIQNSALIRCVVSEEVH